MIRRARYLKTALILLLVVVSFQFCSREDAGVIADSFEYRNNGIDFTKEELSTEEYGNWVQTPGNGCIKIKSIGDVNFKLFRKPLEYMICSENNYQAMEKSVFENKLKQLDGLEYFDLRIEMKEKNGDLLKHVANGYSVYDTLVKYYSFKAQEDIWLLCGNDTVKCAMMHFERTYGSVPYLSFVIAFKSSPIISRAEDLTFVLNDKVFDKGIVKINYSKAELTNLPKLKL